MKLRSENLSVLSNHQLKMNGNNRGTQSVKIIENKDDKLKFQSSQSHIVKVSVRM